MLRRSTVMLCGAGALALLTGIGWALTDGSLSCASAQGNACASACRSAHNDCRIRTKGSPSCDAALQACMQGCLKR